MFREGGSKSALMVIVPLLAIVILAADINYCVAGVENAWVTGADERCGGIFGKHTKHVHCQSLVGMEVTIVRADERSCHFDALGRDFCSHLEGLS